MLSLNLHTEAGIDELGIIIKQGAEQSEDGSDRNHKYKRDIM